MLKETRKIVLFLFILFNSVLLLNCLSPQRNQENPKNASESGKYVEKASCLGVNNCCHTARSSKLVYKCLRVTLNRLHRELCTQN